MAFAPLASNTAPQSLAPNTAPQSYLSLPGAMTQGTSAPVTSGGAGVESNDPISPQKLGKNTGDARSNLAFSTAGRGGKIDKDA